MESLQKLSARDFMFSQLENLPKWLFKLSYLFICMHFCDAGVVTHNWNYHFHHTIYTPGIICKFRSHYRPCWHNVYHLEMKTFHLSFKEENSYILIQNLGFPSKFYFHEMLITSALHKWYSPSNAREATGESTSDVELSSKSDKGDNTSLPCCSPLKLTYWHDENH